MDLKPGDKVICIDTTPMNGSINRPAHLKEDGIYTVRYVSKDRLCIDEHPEPDYYRARFRKLSNNFIPSKGESYVKNR
jgi:hypothetical protein